MSNALEIVVVLVWFAILSAVSTFVLFGLDIRYGDWRDGELNPNDWLVKIWRRKSVAEHKGEQ